MSSDDGAAQSGWRVLTPTPRAWVEKVRGELTTFLQDHAACERKASATAMTFASHYRDKAELVGAMVDLACEELEHFRRVYGWLAARGSTLGPDAKDEYVVRLMGLVRRGPELYLLDRLLVAGVVEARGCERFRLLGEELAGDLAAEYRELARCEARHAALFAGLAKRYFAPNEVEQRAKELFRAEAEIVETLPLRAALH